MSKDRYSLLREIDLKDEKIRQYEEIILKKNGDLELFKSLFPNDPAAVHTLMHELSDISQFSGIVRRDTRKNISNVDHYRGPALSGRFLLASASLLAKSGLFEDGGMGCARAIIGLEIQDRILSYLWVNKLSDNAIDFAPKADGAYVMNVVEETDLLIEIATQHEDRRSLDIFLSVSFLCTLSNDINQSTKTHIIDRNKILLKNNWDGGFSADSLNPNVFPQCSACVALLGMADGLSRGEAGLTPEFLDFLIDGTDSVLRNVLILESQNKDSRIVYDWEAWGRNPA